jgi:phosphate transport system protein
MQERQKKLGGHIVRSYDDELSAMGALMQTMGERIQEQLAKSLEATLTLDQSLALMVIEEDDEVDRLALDIHELTFDMLSLRQPTAIDLRTIITARKISTNLERIGDYATNIAKRSMLLCKHPRFESLSAIPRMGTMTSDLLASVLKAYREMDLSLALEVWRGDEALDETYTALFREILTYMFEDQKTISRCIHILFMIRNLERIGDHSVNIAEAVHFLITGRMPTGKRPKPDEWVEFNDGETFPPHHET